jgi:hypothetical protein
MQLATNWLLELRGRARIDTFVIQHDDLCARSTTRIALVESKRDADGRWALDVQYPGGLPVAIDEGEGRPSR